MGGLSSADLRNKLRPMRCSRDQRGRCIFNCTSRSSNAELAAHVARIPPAVEFRGELAHVLWQLDLECDQLVAAPAALAGKALALEAQHLARAGARGDGEHHRTIDRRHL